MTKFYTNQSLTSAINEPYLTSGSRNNRNLGSSGSTGFLKDIYYCTTSSPTNSQLFDKNFCRRNGVDDPSGGNTSQLRVAFNLSTGFPNTTFKYRVSGPQIDGNKGAKIITQNVVNMSI